MISRTESVSAHFSGATTLAFLRNTGIVVLGSLLVAVCAHISLPLSFTPVPLTLQPFAVLLLGLMLSPRIASMTMAAYLMEGAIGLPVFAPGPAGASGLAHLIGPTGGYLLAYPVAVYAIALLWRAGNRSLARALASAAAGNVIILAVGALWLGIFTGASLTTVLIQAVVPFLPGDALKVAAAALAGFGWHRIRRYRAGLNS